MIYGRRPVLTRTSLKHKQFKARARTSYHDTLAILAEVFDTSVRIPHVAGAWTERKKIFHGGFFFKLADDNKYIKNPETQNREVNGF